MPSLASSWSLPRTVHNGWEAASPFILLPRPPIKMGLSSGPNRLPPSSDIQRPSCLLGSNPVCKENSGIQQPSTKVDWRALSPQNPKSTHTFCWMPFQIANLISGLSTSSTISFSGMDGQTAQRTLSLQRNFQTNLFGKLGQHKLVSHSGNRRFNDQWKWCQEMTNPNP